MGLKLNGYGFPKSVERVVQPIIEAFNPKDLDEFAKNIAELALKIITSIEAGTLSAQEADQCFTLIDLYISETHPDLKLTTEVKDLMFEGMILHDLGKSFGPELSKIREMALNILKSHKK